MVSLLFVLGALFGSFSNVIIYRLPLELSIVFPRSFCPGCKKKISWYENIPILSFILLKGKCSACAAKIPYSYLANELVFGAVFALAYVWLGGMTARTILFLTAFFFIFNISAIDFRHFIIPDGLDFTMLLFGLALSFANPVLKNDPVFYFFAEKLSSFSFQYPVYSRILTSVSGALTGFGMLFIVRFAGGKIFKKEAMGLGDVKYMLALGAWTGPLSVFYVLFLASLAGALVSLFLIFSGRKSRKDEIPFGPFLSFGFIVVLSYVLLFDKIS